MLTLLHPAAKFPLLTDLALLVARLVLGVVLIAHGWQKYSEWTVAGTGQSFAEMGILAPDFSAALVTGAEIIGGVALILGVLTPVFAVVNGVSMIVAALVVHAEAGIFVEDGGYELVAAIFAGLIILAATGGGRFSVDRLLAPRSKSARQTAAA
ncbi:DoxX family protein [Brevibacterium jeotgali]|uniref:Putative oxidoreductase n=1 Tax=Brevibacterium jeotgali TaxID=1262550 RepID=A0A2H1L4W0_9MICO|nr:DoxX family protein [Brevibacterium jeotgali]TWB98634.1 putative oxidoreductase [Brevibacterium jeotgali]SMY11765.1 putative oxidoreductase [Brevibacterium jeotgali]